MRKDVSGVDILAGLLLALLMLPVAAIVNGYVLMSFWGWFILPVFPSLPALTTASAIGISFIWHAQFATDTSDLAKADSNDSVTESAFYMIFGTFGKAVFRFVLGYIIYVFIY